MNKRRQVVARYNGMLHHSTAIDALIALIGATLVVGPFALALFNLI